MKYTVNVNLIDAEIINTETGERTTIYTDLYEFFETSLTGGTVDMAVAMCESGYRKELRERFPDISADNIDSIVHALMDRSESYLRKNWDTWGKTPEEVGYSTKEAAIAAGIENPTHFKCNECGIYFWGERKVDNILCGEVSWKQTACPVCGVDDPLFVVPCSEE